MNDPLMNVYWFYPFLQGIALAWGWHKTKNLFKGIVSLNASLAYVFLATLPGMLITYSTYNMSFLMIITWLVSGFLQVWVSLIVISLMNKQNK